MKFLHDKRRAGVLALLSAMLGAAALMFGIGGAGADTCGTTSGSLGDATVYVPGVVAADLDTEHVGSSQDPGFWACAVPPNQGAGIALRDNNGSTTGKQLEATTCGTLLGGCTTVEDTGAEVDPATSTNEPYDATTGTGGSVGTGSGTCVYVDGTSDCSAAGIEIAGLTVNEGDAADPNTPGTGCWLGVGSTCGVQNTGIGVGQDGGDTVTATIAGTPVPPVNVPNECIQLGATC